MADIFTKNDAQRVVEFKVIWFCGDSNVRAIYKDLVWLLQRNSLIDQSVLRNRLEISYMNDYLIKGEMLHKGRNYSEVRVFEDSAIPTRIEFTFLTECLSADFRKKIETHLTKEAPDIIVMNSCLWDITRWGPNGVKRYKKNIKELLRLFREYLPSKTLVIWTTTPPLSNEPQGGFLIKQINFMKPFLRFEVMEANAYVQEEFIKSGFDVLDIHYHLMLQIHRRRPDGIHWDPDAVRHVTNLLLTHISLSCNKPLPGNFTSPVLDKTVNMENRKRENKNGDGNSKAVVVHDENNKNSNTDGNSLTLNSGGNNINNNNNNNNNSNNKGHIEKYKFDSKKNETKKISKSKCRKRKSFINWNDQYAVGQSNFLGHNMNNKRAAQNFKTSGKYFKRHCYNYRPY